MGSNKTEEIQEAVCKNMVALIERGEIKEYICKKTGGRPACHLRANEAEFVDLYDCKNRE